MASITITINYPDGQGTRIMSALKKKYNVATNAQARNVLETDVKAMVKSIVHSVEESEREPITDADIT
jgi:hypothetical protein